MTTDLVVDWRACTRRAPRWRWWTGSRRRAPRRRWRRCSSPATCTRCVTCVCSAAWRSTCRAPALQCSRVRTGQLVGHLHHQPFDGVRRVRRPGGRCALVRAIELPVLFPSSVLVAVCAGLHSAKVAQVFTETHQATGLSLSRLRGMVRDIYAHMASRMDTRVTAAMAYVVRKFWCSCYDGIFLNSQGLKRLRAITRNAERGQTRGASAHAQVEGRRSGSVRRRGTARRANQKTSSRPARSHSTWREKHNSSSAGCTPDTTSSSTRSTACTCTTDQATHLKCEVAEELHAELGELLI